MIVWPLILFTTLRMALLVDTHGLVHPLSDVSSF